MIQIIANLKSGKGRGIKNVRKIIKYCLEKNITYALYITNKPGHATEIARDLTVNGGTIVALGGDGTFHEVLNGIVDLENTTLGFIPSGRGNDFSRSLGCSLDPIKALEDILRGEIRNIDFIQIKDKRCLNVAGTGLDIDVLERVAGKTGKITYLTSLLYCLRHFDPYHISMTIDGVTTEYDCIMAGVCNGGIFGGNIPLSPVSKIDDGKLDVIAITMPKDGKIFPVVPKFLKGNHMNMDITHHFCVDEVTITSEKPVQLDGEIYRDLSLDCKIMKGALKTFVTHR